MIGEMLVWGFFSALGWMGANWTVDKIIPEKHVKQEQKCTSWEEVKNPDGTVSRTRTCEKSSP